MILDEAVKKIEEEMLLTKANVIGIGPGLKVKNGEVTEEESIVFIVSNKIKKESLVSSELIPKEIFGIKTDIIEEKLEPHAIWQKPFMQGDEVYSQRAVGTIGMIFRWNGKDYGLTNYHVIDYCNNDIIGQRVKHPGSGHAPVIGKIVRSANPDKGFADAAIFEITLNKSDPISPEMGWNAPGSRWDRNIDSYAQIFPTLGLAANVCGFPHHHREYDGNIRDYNTGGHLPFANGFGKVSLGEEVWKSGRTSGTTPAVVQMKNASVYIMYKDKPRLMKHQIRCHPLPGTHIPISIPGDSGSCWVDNSNHIVSLNFAGGFTQTYSSSISTPIQIVFREMFSPDELIGYNLNHENGWNIDHDEYAEDYALI